MEPWEYKIVVINAYYGIKRDELDEYGKQGWELVSIIRGKQDYHLDEREFYFKRKYEEHKKLLPWYMEKAW